MTSATRRSGPVSRPFTRAMRSDLCWGFKGSTVDNPEMPTEYVKEFDFDLARAVVDQLIESLSALTVGMLNTANLGHVQNVQGVYQLFHRDVAVYVGKADRSLKTRLKRHLRSLSARQNIDIDTLGFKALYIHRNWTTWTSEDVLLRRFAGTCAWNSSGYGSNDPGRNREQTDFGTEHFHQQFPIRADWEVREVQPGRYEANALLQQVKKALPYLFRYETSNRKRWRQGSSKYNGAEIVVEKANMTADALIASIARQLGPTWQATRFPSHYIMYQESRTYAHGVKIEPV